MRSSPVALLAACSFLVACPAPKPPATAKPEVKPSATPAATPATSELLTEDSPRTTVAGNTFLAPQGWRISVRGPATILEPPEADSHIALVDVAADDAAGAVAAAWKVYLPGASWPLLVANDRPDREGWDHTRSFEYQTSPNEHRDVRATAMHSAGGWTVAIFDMAQATEEKRLAQVVLVFGRFFPKGYQRESFAGKKANRLDEARLAELRKFVESSRVALGIPGVSIGVVQDGKVVFEGGFGTREPGGKENVDASSLYMIASNTKALTTLMLARLVDEKKLGWETPVTTLLPGFKLGDEDTTRRVLVKHLVCACTGLPRQDFEWLFQFKGVTPEGALGTLAAVQPTSKFGEMFQYSNLLAGAGGFVGGHVLFPKKELGAAYDEAMRTRVFEPLGMRSTTFDFARARKANHAGPSAPDVDGKTGHAVMELNSSIIPLRPAGGAWSSAHDLLRYVTMELGEGTLDGTRIVSKEALLARRAAQVPIGKDVTYGMGLEVDTTWGVPVVHHGGSMIGYKSDMLFLPEHGVGAVILTNSDAGQLLLTPFRRKILEILFDGKPQADGDIAAGAKTLFEDLAAQRKTITVPAEAAEAAKLADHYVNAGLGDLDVRRAGGVTTFDFGEWKSAVASRHDPDGSVTFVTIAPGIAGLEFVVGSGAKHTLTLRDAQHEYVFTEK